MITFKEIEFKNFLSVGDMPIKILLDRSPSTLITAPNGSGKSTISDALIFVLFDKSYRGIKKSSLVNSLNKKDCVVTLKFTKSTDEYVVVRGVKPNVFDITKNGSKLDDNAATKDKQEYLENFILGFNFKSFCQTTVLGTANYTPFMQLNAAMRREVIETLFGINVFSSMNILLKARIKDWKQDVENVKKEIEMLENNRAIQKNFVETLEKDNSALLEEKKKKLADLKTKLLEKQELQKVYEKKSTKLANYKKAYNASNTNKSRIKNELDNNQRTINQIEKKKKDLEESSESDCPTCLQKISKEHIDKCTTTLVGELDYYLSNHSTIKTKLQEAEKELEAIKENASKYDNADVELASINSTIKSLVSQGKELSSEFKQLKEKSENGNLDKAKKDLEVIVQELKQKIQDKEKLMEMEPVYKTALACLKDDGIKAKIISQYLPILNQRVNHYLSMMDFPVRFELDEDFNESIKSKNFTEFNYGNFSMGERQRIDLSLLFAWRDVAAMKNSVNTNILILDEVADASMDADGTTALMTFIENEPKTNFFVVSHKSNLEENLYSTIRMKKVNGFTKIV